MAVNIEMKARPYQLELVDHLCKRDGIVYLPTGSGKTFVAILVLKRLSSPLQYPLDKGGRRTVFMCNTVELARQQCLEIRKNTNLKVGLYIGDRDVDNWNGSQWALEFEENQVFVGTAQVFVDSVLHSYIKITDFNLVIIDECHHATKNHPMHSFLSLVQNVKVSERPRIIGLTGVLIKGNKLNTIEQELKNLEASFSGRIVTVRSLEQFNNVMLYTTKPKEHIITYIANDYKFEIEKKINAIVADWKAVINVYDIGTVIPKLSKGLEKQREPNKKNKITNLIDDFMYQAKDFGLYTASIAIMSLLIEFEVKKRQSESIALRNLYRYCITRCEHIRHLLVKQLKTMVDEDSYPDIHIKDSMCNTQNIIMNFSTSKLRCFLSTLKETFKDKVYEDITCLVFVQRRYTAKCIYYVLQKYLNDCPELKDIVIPQYLVGRQNIAYGIESVLDNKWNTNVMRQFHKKECNLIICSNVLEEGIDVQACNYVFVLDELGTFNSYIQTKGRARSDVASYTIFCNNLHVSSTIEKIKAYNVAHDYIKEFLLKRILNSEGPHMDEINEQFATKIQPYKISSGAQLVATSVLSLLNRYCQTLPWDAYGSISPLFYKVPCESGCQVAVQLPLQSRLKETIKSDIMQNSKEAKASAAFKACVKLYELGELNDHLLPVTKTECIQSVSEDLFQHWKKHTNNASEQLIGKSYVRLYNKQCPGELYDALPRIGQKCYAYSIQFFVDFPKNDYNEHVVNYLNTKATYAILVGKKLPNLAEMPLFMSQGKLRVKIAGSPIECMVHNDKDLEQLKAFHVMIFRDLLEIWKEFYVIDRRNKENAYLIAPVDSLGCIDWNLVQNFQRLLPPQFNIPNNQTAKIYNPEDFLDKVVTKWYNEAENERYVVVKVRHDLNPMSPFDNNRYENYAQYFQSRYNVKVNDNTQFLLEVRALTKRRNFFINAIGKSAEIKKDRLNAIFIPELCHNYNFPANMWLKALLLPTILHRVYYMLHAETLRQKINTFLDLDKYFTQYNPSALIVDASLKRAVDSDGLTIKKKEAKKFQTSLNPKTHINNLNMQRLDMINMGWKEYMEPIDHARRIVDVFPIEIDYYQKFINGKVFDIGNVEIQNDDIWSKSQLELPSIPKVSRNDMLLNSTTVNPNSAIINVPDKDKYYINILEQSFKSASDLQSAEQYEFLAAITTAGVSDVFDMERFELLGDAFLKFSVSLYLANKYPHWNEGYLSTIKSRMVSNRNLLYCMLELDICNRICGSPFSPSISWLPPLIALPNNLLQLLSNSNRPVIANINPRDFHSMQLTEKEIQTGVCDPQKLSAFLKAFESLEEQVNAKTNINFESDMYMYVYKELYKDKIIADTLEALLGVCVKNYGICRTFKMLEFFGIVKPGPNLPLTNLLDLQFNFGQKRCHIESKEIDKFLVNADKLEQNLGYKFHDRAYLLQALTHPSNPTNRITGCYQELEFIGDAILDMLITCYIFERNEHMTPGMMTDLRTALVNNVTLGCVCVRHRFHLFMLYENAVLSESINRFAEYQEAQGYRITDQTRILLEEDSGYQDDECEENMVYDSSNGSTELSNNKRNFNFSENVDVPKALGDIVEALIAAVYLDSKDLQITWRVIYNLLELELMQFSSDIPRDPVRQLMEAKLADAHFSDPVKDNDIVMVKCAFICMDKSIEVDGFGTNAKKAKNAAATHALRILSQSGE